MGVWDSFNGSGVVISVIDDGVEHSHPDLTDNYVSVHLTTGVAMMLILILPLQMGMDGSSRSCRWNWE